MQTDITLGRGKPRESRKTILDGLYRAIREPFDAPKYDRFKTIPKRNAEGIDYGPFLGIAP